MEKEILERLEKQMAFIREADREKFIGRQTYLTGAERRENDAEHAWHLALMALLLSEYSNEKIDLLKTIAMVIIHDIVEIDAGDTYAYDEAGLSTQKEREAKAADRIFGLLPDDQRDRFRAIFEEFEACETPEARFAKVLDNFQPMMLNDHTGGRAWKEHGVHDTQILRRNAVTPLGSEILWEYAKKNFIDRNIEKGNIIKD